MKPREISDSTDSSSLGAKDQSKASGRSGRFEPAAERRLMKRVEIEGDGDSASATGKALEPADCRQDQAESVGAV